MATITERTRARGKASFTAQVRIKQNGEVVFSQAQTFDQRKLAEKWAVRTEKEWRSGRIPIAPRREETFSELITRYRNDIDGECGKTVLQCLRTLERMPETQCPRSEVTSSYLVDLGRTLKRGGRSAATVNNYMQHLYGLFAVAEDGYKATLKYDDMQKAMRAMRKLKIVGKSGKRTRRPALEELNKLMEQAYARTTRSYAGPLHKIIAFAIVSSRRLSEITRIRWHDLNLEDKKVLVREMKHPGQKKGNDVWVSLTNEALNIILSMPRVDERIFPYSAATLSTGFTRLVELFDEIEDLHFHDLRHEAISRAFEMGWSVAEVRMMSGHRSWSSLEVYTNLQKVGDRLHDWKWWDVVCQPETPERIRALKRHLATRTTSKPTSKKQVGMMSA